MEDVLRALSVARRRFGATPVELSAICYGTMRLGAPRFDRRAVETLFIEALDRGISSFHVSHEYESYAQVCEALRRARSARPNAPFEVVAKIAVPHFDEVAIRPGRLRNLVENTLRDLDVPTVDVVQWLVRHTPNDDAPRLALLERGAGAFEAEWTRLRDAGRVRALGAFPYSMPFLEHALDLPFVDGVVSYYNERERELEPFLARLERERRGLAGIRPLCAGEVRDPEAVTRAVRFALQPAVAACTIVGLSSTAQIDAALAAAG